MTLRRTVLSLLIAGACTPVFAGTVDLTALDDATLSPRFIVQYKNGSAERFKIEIVSHVEHPKIQRSGSS